MPKYWGLVVSVDGVRTADAHLDSDRVHTILSRWALSPKQLSFHILACPCLECVPESVQATQKRAVNG